MVFAPADKGHFEPIKEASLKHLTFKTVFLLALGLGKCRSEIHAWQTDILDTNPIGQGVPVSITQLSILESAGHRGSRQCGPWGYNSPGPNSG